MIGELRLVLLLNYDIGRFPLLGKTILKIFYRIIFLYFEKDIFSFSVDFIEYKTNKIEEKKFIKSIFEKIRKYQNEQYLSYFSEEDEF